MMIILSLLLCSCIIQASLSQVYQGESSYRPNKAGGRGVIYYPGGPRWSYNVDKAQTTPAPKEAKGSYQTYDLRGMKHYDTSGEGSQKFSDYSRSSVEPVLYQKTEEPSGHHQRQKISFPRPLREYRVTESHHRDQRPQSERQQSKRQQSERQQSQRQQSQRQQSQRQQSQPSFFLITPTTDDNWGKDEREWAKKADSLWDKSDEREWSQAIKREWNQKPDNMDNNWDQKSNRDWDQKVVIDWEPNSSERKTYKQDQDYRPNEEYRSTPKQERPNQVYQKGTYATERKEVKKEGMDNYGRQGYLIAKPPRNTGRLVSRYKDPCVRKPDGQYVLSGGFHALFPYVENMCYFVKCANKKAFMNPCSPGTRNDEKGDGFCSHLDLEGYCGITVYDTAKQNQLKLAVQPKPDNNYHEYLHGTYHRSQRD